MTESMYFRTRLRAKGQITVPDQVREILGADEGDEIAFRVTEAGQIVIEKLQVISFRKVYKTKNNRLEVMLPSEENGDKSLD
jgi:AbrB family looped-hinge helix DNA binding protein